MALLNTADAVYAGVNLADRVYKGADLVWGSAPVSGPFVSDEFNDASLNGSLWTSVDPHAVSTISVSGGQLSMSIPAGTGYSTYSDAGLGVRQPCADTDFQVEARFTSTTDTKYQSNTIGVWGTGDNMVMLEVYSNPPNIRVSAINRTSGTSAEEYNSVFSAPDPIRLRITRVGNNWDFEYSPDATSWTSFGNFNKTMTVDEIGPVTGTGGDLPAFECLVDYFRDTT